MNDSLPIGWRSDAPLIKQFEHLYGSKMAQKWQRQPLIDLREEQERFEAALPTLQERVPSIAHQPFEQFVMDCGTNQGTRIWVHVMPLGKLMSISPDLYPWKSETIRQLKEIDRAWEVSFEDCSLASAWGMTSRGIEKGVTLVIEHDYWSAGAYDVSRGREMETTAAITFSVGARIAYLCSPPDRFVLVTPKRAMKERTDRKVWTNGAPSIRILNLHTLKISRPSGIGTHASPRPHLRRGGTVTYLHPRWYSNWNAGDGIPLAAPLDVAEVAYRRESFLSGLDASGHPVISKKIGSHWYSLDVRQNERCSAEVLASIDGAEIDGAIYKVLER